MFFGFGRTVRHDLPMRANLVPLHTVWYYLSAGSGLTITARLVNLLGNVAVFIPVGLLIPLAAGRLLTAGRHIEKKETMNTMFTDLKTRIDSPDVEELLSYAVISDPGELERVHAEYKEEAALQLYGWEDEGLLVGLIGFEMTEDGSIDIRHIAVLPENRGKGYARGMILELLAERQPRYVVAETEDESAANFYRSLGFMVYSLGENPSGIEQLRCVYEVEESED